MYGDNRRSTAGVLQYVCTINNQQLPYVAYGDTQCLVQLPVSIAHCLSLQNALPATVTVTVETLAAVATNPNSASQHAN